jgi:class 3 adenylate cyclase
MSIGSAIKVRRRISTLLFIILTSMAGLVLLGLVVMIVRLVEIRDDLGALRDSALPRLVKLSQLSQEAAATISIAPALSAKPTRFEFETLLSRIKDKEISQKALIEELATLIRDEDAASTLRRNGDLLIENLRTLTGVVSQQISVRKRLEMHVEFCRRLARPLSDPVVAPRAEEAPETNHPAEYSARVRQLAGTNVFRLLNTLLDPNSARFSRNRNELEKGLERLAQALGDDKKPLAKQTNGALAPARELLRYWSSKRAQIYQDKQAELSNDFKIKALVEENSLIANRLLSSASNEFWRASAELETQIGSVDRTARFTLASILVVVAAFAVGNFFVWFVLKKRVFQRLDRIRNALQAFADNRDRPSADKVADEIGAISGSLIRYMAVIDEREAELAEKTHALEQLSNQLAKYLSPQVYDSIFSGKQEVKIASSRKKLTIFFSDIAGFTETADRLESEELTQLLNHYLTEMSRIALDHGATIDKYVGDAILIFFGDPETKGVREDALACVTMAIAMRKRMHDLADIWRESGTEKPLQVRMGIHTGYCTVGNFGSEDRMDYTIIGGAVNTASRLETLATPGEILISYETFAHVKEQIRCEEHGEIEVKGIAYPVATYHVVNSYEDLGRERRHFREDHPNVVLDLDLDAMTTDDRSHAATILRRGLDLLSSSDKPVRPEHAAEKDPDLEGPTRSKSGHVKRLRKSF